MNITIINITAMNITSMNIEKTSTVGGLAEEATTMQNEAVEEKEMDLKMALLYGSALIGLQLLILIIRYFCIKKVWLYILLPTLYFKFCGDQQWWRKWWGPGIR